MKDLILFSLYPVLLIRGENLRLIYLPLLILYYNETGYGNFLCFCCFVELSEIFLRKSKQFFSEENENIPELLLCVYDVLFCVLSLISYESPPSLSCDASRYLDSVGSNFLFILCFSRYGYELSYVLRPCWFAKRPIDRNIPSLCLTLACLGFSTIFGVWRKCIEILMIRHFLEVVKKSSRICTLFGHETAGGRLSKIHSVCVKMSVPFSIISVLYGGIGGGDTFCEFVILITYALGSVAFWIEQYSVY